MMDVDAGAPPWAGRYRRLRVLRVLNAVHVTPRLRRITLGGEESVGLPTGPNLKLIIPPPGVTEPEWPMQGPGGRPVWPPEDRRPTVRTYSVRRHDPLTGEIDVDFVLHGHGGVAAAWATSARPGDVIGIGGPGGRTLVPAAWYLLVGDETGLPSISRILEELPATAQGEALIEVTDASDEQPVTTSSQVRVTWLHRGSAEPGTTSLLADAVRTLTWPRDEQVSAWITGESSSVRAVRAHLREAHGLDAAQLVAIGYWRLGLSENAYREQHDHDRERSPADDGSTAHHGATP